VTGQWDPATRTYMGRRPHDYFFLQFSYFVFLIFFYIYKPSAKRFAKMYPTRRKVTAPWVNAMAA